MGIIIIISSLNLTDISWTPIKVGLVISIVISQIMFFGGLFIIGSTITFWTVESIEFINVFTYGGSYMISHPMHIYPDMFRRFFTYIIPAIFLSYYPALYIFNISDPFNYPSWAPFLAPIPGCTILVIALGFWIFGIRHYQSTGT
jgi:ABC-2 type transport system permease protein